MLRGGGAPGVRHVLFSARCRVHSQASRCAWRQSMPIRWRATAWRRYRRANARAYLKLTPALTNTAKVPAATLVGHRRSSDTRNVTVAVHLRLPGRGEPPYGLAQSTVFSVASTLRNVVRLTLPTHMASHTLRSDDNRVSLLDCEHQQHRNSRTCHESANRQRRSCTKYVPRDSHGGMTSVPNGRAPCDMWFRG